MRTRYDENETMKLLGHQYLNRMMGNEEFHKMLEIMDAHKCNSPRLHPAATDIYMWGFINGQRHERTKKRK